MTEKINPEMAAQEFERFIESNNIFIDLDSYDAAEKRDYQTDKNLLVRQIMRGTLVINESGLPEYTLEDGKVLKFKRMTGATMLAQDGKKQNDDVRRLHSMLAQITGETPQSFSKVFRSDLKVCESILLFFLA